MAYKILTKDHIVAILMALAPRFVGRDQDHLLGLADEAAWAAYDRAYDAIEPLQEFDQLLQGPAGASVIGITDLGNYYTGTTIEEALEQVGAFIDEGPYIRESEKGVPNGVATLAGDGRLEPGQLPQLAITDTFEASSEAVMLGLPAEKGDVAVRTDLNQSFILAAEPASSLSNWTLLRSPTDSVTSVFGRVGVVTAEAGDYTAAQVGADPAGTAAALLTQTITDGDTTHTPSGDAVFDALTGKADASGVWALGISGPAAPVFNGDLNDAIGSHSVYATGSTNHPPAGKGFVWGSTWADGSYGIQEWGRANRRFFRPLEAGSWGSWMEYFHTGNLDPSSFLGTDNDRNFITDTRGASRAPNYYDPRYAQWDFQNTADTGAGGDSWNTLLTVFPWSNYNDSHRPQQLAFTGAGGLKFRYATSDTTWEGWQSLITANPVGNVSIPSYVYVGGRIYNHNTGDFWIVGGGSYGVGLRPQGWSTVGQFYVSNNGDASTYRDHEASTFRPRSNILLENATYGGLGGASGGGQIWYGAGGTMYIRPNGRTTSSGQMTLSTSGNVTANDFISTSDATFKYDIKDFQLRAPLRPRQYKWIDDDSSDIGFVAQEVQEHYPELVVATRDEDDGPEYLRLNYAKLTVVLAAQINEMQKQIDELKEKLGDGR